MKIRGALWLAAALLLCAAPAMGETAAVTRGTITDTVFGPGTIQPASQPGVYAAVSGTVGEVLAGMGDEVRAGDILLRLEDETLDAQIAQLEYDLQIAMGEVTDVKTHSQYKYVQLTDEAGELRYDVNTGEPLMGKYSNEITIRAPGDGRVMAIAIEPGDDALAVYREVGYVMMLSTDGRMKVELDGIDGAGLALGDWLAVRGEGIDTKGRVVGLARRGTQATLQVMSDEYPMGARVGVYAPDGTLIGEGTLEINKPLAVSAYGGRIKGIEYGVEIGAYVEREDVLARIEWSDIPLYLSNDSVLREYAKAQAALEDAMEKREALAVTAPCDGKVASIDVSTGDSVEDGAKLGSIVGNDGMRVILSVDELDIVQVQPGQAVDMSVDALPGVKIAGTVEKIAPIGKTSSGVTAYDVYVTVGEADSRVLGGMNVSGSITVATAEDALLIPTDALCKDTEGWYVSMENGEARRVSVGLMTDERTQITHGLSAGETVAY